MTSNYSYLANAQRRLSRRVRWMAMFNGFHTGLGELDGESAHAESYGTNLVYKMYNVGANYSHTSGTVLLTANGLVAPPGRFRRFAGEYVPAGYRVVVLVQLYCKPDAQVGGEHELHEDDQ